MLKDSNLIQSEESQNKNKIINEAFSFLFGENISQEEFEKSMNHLLSLNVKEKENISLLLSIDKEIISLMINNSIKFNKTILSIKLLINLAQLKNNFNLNEKKFDSIDFNDCIVNCFKKQCELVDFFQNNLKEGESKSISSIINNYEDILLIISDYLSKEINTSLSLSLLEKYILKIIQEKIYTFYIIFSIVLYNLCKNPIFKNIKEYINLMKLNNLPLSSSALNSYIDLLCRSNRLEECQSFFEEIMPYKPLLIIPYSFPLQTDTENNNMNPNESKSIYEKHISSFGINIISFGIFLKYLCKNDHLDLALLYFDQLNSKKMLKDEIIFNLILNGCSKKGDFENLYRVYEEMLNNGIKPTNITMNTIIDAFVRNNEIEKAWKIFGEMFKNQINPDNFTLSTLFRGIKTMNHYEYLIKGIDLVKQKSESIDIILINVLLDACIKLKDSKDFLDLFENLINGKFSNNKIDNDNEITNHSENQNQIITNNVIKPDLITYNTFIKGCTQLKLYDKVDYAFEHLINNKDVNIIPNDVTFNSLIDAYVRQNNMNKVFKLISIMQQYHIKPDNFTYTTIIKGLNKDSFSSNNNNIGDYKNRSKDELDLAFQLFEKVKQFSKPDEILYNCIMDACLRFNKVDKMLELYKEMLENNISPSSVTCGIVIKGYGMKGDVDSALKVYQHMKINKIEISSVTYGCLINVCTKNNKLSKAFELYESLTREGIEMNTILYTTLIKAYSKTKNLNKVIEILNIMIKSNNSKPNIITYNSVIDCCIKCRNYDLAYKYYNYLIANVNYNLNNENNRNDDSIVKPDIVTFSTLIKGEIHNGCFEKAKMLMNKMLEYDYIKPDCILLNTMLDGCEKCSCYEEALDIYNLFKKKNVQFNMMTYSILLKILGVLCDFENSLKLFEEIKNKENNISMNLIIITCFIKTCFSTNHIKEAIDTFNSMKKYKINPDAISYITMINGIINNSKNFETYGIEYSKELINIIKSSVNDNVILQSKNYIKAINYLKHVDKDIYEELCKYLKEKELFDYQPKNNKNKKYTNNNSIENYSNQNKNNNEKEDNKENDNKESFNNTNNVNYQSRKNKFNNYYGYDYNKNRKPFKQIFYNNYDNTFNNNQNINLKKNNNNNEFDYYGNINEKNNEYKNNNNYWYNNKWKNSNNKEKAYYNKKKGNNFY